MRGGERGRAAYRQKKVIQKRVVDLSSKEFAKGESYRGRAGRGECLSSTGGGAFECCAGKKKKRGGRRKSFPASLIAGKRDEDAWGPTSFKNTRKGKGEFPRGRRISGRQEKEGTRRGPSLQRQKWESQRGETPHLELEGLSTKCKWEGGKGRTLYYWGKKKGGAATSIRPTVYYAKAIMPARVETKGGEGVGS